MILVASFCAWGWTSNDSLPDTVDDSFSGHLFSRQYTSGVPERTALVKQWPLTVQVWHASLLVDWMPMAIFQHSATAQLPAVAAVAAVAQTLHLSLV